MRYNFPTMKPPLDKFHTKPEVAAACFATAAELCRKELGGARKWIEPAAGRGEFFRLLPPQARTGGDVAPEWVGIPARDFLLWTPKFSPVRVVAVGNPPFGRRGRDAVAFLNRASELAETVAFILPALFAKYSAQKKIRDDMRLVADVPLDDNSFYTTGGDFQCRCRFQIWTRRETALPDLRLRKAPPVSHPHFEMRQYNNTAAAEKVFHAPFDFAVPRQGYENYARRETSPEQCERRKQWALFRANHPAALKRLMQMDFHALSRKNTTTPGFGKADVVAEYQRLINSSQ